MDPRKVFSSVFKQAKIKGALLLSVDILFKTMSTIRGTWRDNCLKIVLSTKSFFIEA